MRITTALASLAISTAMLPVLAAPSQAGHRDYGRGYEDGAVITAHSRHGNGAIEGYVRRGRHAWEVQLPGGTWISCRRSCEETLRVETVDIFETGGRMSGYGTLQNQCGVFGCLELNF
jgi:hypothetical protein